MPFTVNYHYYVYQYATSMTYAAARAYFQNLLDQYK